MFSLAGLGNGSATKVGPFSDRLADFGASLQPLHVALLGCGTVGSGVYQRLAALPEFFVTTGVGTLTGVRAKAAGVPGDLITSDLEALVAKPCDVVIELIGGTKRAASLIEFALQRGRDVISANKALLAAEGQRLETLAAKSGARLRFNAAVGGVLPALETIRRIRTSGPLRAFSGILNGTSNFVLDQLVEGKTISSAVRAAQELGYSEMDPQLDLNGIDAAQKLILLARAAFDTNIPLESIELQGIDSLNSAQLRSVQERGLVVRLVAECRRTDRGLKASIKPIELPPNHTLAQVRGPENRLFLERDVGEPVVVSGTGAGRWPATEAVMADLLDIRREVQWAKAHNETEGREECVA